MSGQIWYELRVFHKGGWDDRGPFRTLTEAVAGADRAYENGALSVLVRDEGGNLHYHRDLSTPEKPPAPPEPPPVRERLSPLAERCGLPRDLTSVSERAAVLGASERDVP